MQKLYRMLVAFLLVVPLFANASSATCSSSLVQDRQIFCYTPNVAFNPGDKISVQTTMIPSGRGSVYRATAQIVKGVGANRVIVAQKFTSGTSAGKLSVTYDVKERNWYYAVIKVDFVGVSGFGVSARMQKLN